MRADIHDGQEQSAPPKGRIQKSKTSHCHSADSACNARPVHTVGSTARVPHASRARQKYLNKRKEPLQRDETPVSATFCRERGKPSRLKPFNHLINAGRSPLDFVKGIALLLIGVYLVGLMRTI